MRVVSRSPSLWAKNSRRKSRVMSLLIKIIHTAFHLSHIVHHTPTPSYTTSHNSLTAPRNLIWRLFAARPQNSEKEPARNSALTSYPLEAFVFRGHVTDLTEYSAISILHAAFVFRPVSKGLNLASLKVWNMQSQLHLNGRRGNMSAKLKIPCTFILALALAGGVTSEPRTRKSERAGSTTKHCRDDMILLTSDHNF